MADANWCCNIADAADVLCRKHRVDRIGGPDVATVTVPEELIQCSTPPLAVPMTAMLHSAPHTDLTEPGDDGISAHRTRRLRRQRQSEALAERDDLLPRRAVHGERHVTGHADVRDLDHPHREIGTRPPDPK